MKNKNIFSNLKYLLILLGSLAVFVSSSFVFLPMVLPIDYVSKDIFLAEVPKEEVWKASHIKTPEAVKAIYMSSWVAGTKSIREGLVSLIDETELNAIVIDVKDSTGRISFEVEDEYLKSFGSVENRISDIKEFIEELHNKNIYVIARIAVFQDSYLAEFRPDLAVKKESDKTVWKDYRGIKWLDAGAKDVWDYTVAISKVAYSVGFDELNYDYIRFPSDGNMRDIYYPFSEERIINNPDLGKAYVMEDFFLYLFNNLKDLDVPLSADLFGMVTTNSDDLNIGQILEYAIPYFDYISPMVYPSHYPKNFNGYGNPNHYPYEVVKFSMEKGVEKVINASSSPLKLRPWLQDFDYGGNYDVAEVRAQIQATYDAGLNSWLLWSASNKYTRGALEESN
jgi:hypothetical protein